jgi:hypothetical protein
VESVVVESEFDLSGRLFSIQAFKRVRTANLRPFCAVSENLYSI